MSTPAPPTIITSTQTPVVTLANDTQPAPPRYASVVKKVYPYTLRPIVIFCSGIGLIWAIAMGVNSIQDRNQANASPRMNLMFLVQAILYFLVALIEAAFIAIAFIQKVALGRTIYILAPLGIALVLGAQIVSIVRHFSLKNDLIAQCTANTVGGSYYNSQGVLSNFSAEQSGAICRTAWDKGTWSVIAWMVISLILACLFASLNLAFYRQMLDPSSVQTRRGRNAGIETYALQPNHNDIYSNNPPPPQGNQNQQSWMVPPYPGPPANMPPKGYEKADYQPEAEWASYGPEGGFGRGGGNDQTQDQAWARAEASGPTAHLTRNVSRDDDGDLGYVVKNQEEDEAWERARTEGVTAHLTGNSPVRNLTGGGSGTGKIV